jgi:Fe-Mn family superoxide dismutase
MLTAVPIFQNSSRILLRRFCSANLVAGKESVVLPELPYDYSALEPHINAEIMELHHSKHHQTYVTNYNSLLEQSEEAGQKQDSHAMLQLSNSLVFNGGGTLL